MSIVQSVQTGTSDDQHFAADQIHGKESIPLFAQSKSLASFNVVAFKLIAPLKLDLKLDLH